MHVHALLVALVLLLADVVGSNAGGDKDSNRNVLPLPTPTPTPEPTTPWPTRDPLGPLKRHPVWHAEFTVAYGSQQVDKIGSFVIEVDPMLAPLGTGRLRQLMEEHFYDNTRFFRVVPGFVAQWGIHGDPRTNARWDTRRFRDDPVLGSNARGTVSFAASGANTRTTQLFVNLADNTAIDQEGFAPIGKVVSGMEIFDELYSEYEVEQGKIEKGGNAFLQQQYAKLSYVISARIVGAGETAGRTLVQCFIKGMPMDPVVIDVRDDFAPHGAARFVELVSDKYYDGMALHRVVEDICMGFGIARDLELRSKWMGNTIPDDPSAEPGLASPRVPFVRGVVSFAGSGRDSRDVNLIIPFRYLDYMGNEHGDAPWEVPIGYVVRGMESFDRIFMEYGDLAPAEDDSVVSRILHRDGYRFLEEHFPQLSYLDRCELMSERENSTLAERQWTVKEYQRVASLLSPPPPDAASEEARALNLEMPRRPVVSKPVRREDAPIEMTPMAPVAAVAALLVLVGVARTCGGKGGGGLLPTFADPKDL